MSISLFAVLLIVFVAGCVGQSGTAPSGGEPAAPTQTTPPPATTEPPATTPPAEPPAEAPSTTPPAAAAELKEFDVTIGHASYRPSSFTVNKGDTIRFNAVADAGTASHNHGVTIDDYNINQAVTSEDASNPVVIEFIADQAGTFTIYCKTCWDGSFGSGHPNIRGTLTVNE